jgi:hypothetical protein
MVLSRRIRGAESICRADDSIGKPRDAHLFNLLDRLCAATDENRKVVAITKLASFLQDARFYIR